MKVPPAQPTDAEIGLLEILWNRGPSTVRDLHVELCAIEGKNIVYTTVLKLLQIMTEKGLVTRDESARSHIYVAALSRESVQHSMLSKISQRLFGGSVQRLVLGALSGQRADVAELEAIKRDIENKIAQARAPEEAEK
jgi:predicted transcriptional regulator